MRICKECIQPDTRPNTFFTENGICPACNYFDKLSDVDWQERFKILQDIAENFPRSNRHNFDCIIGVSGGKDSVRQAIFVRDKLGLNPLLACLSYPPQQITQIGVNNISTLINLGFDCVVSNRRTFWRSRHRVESGRLHRRVCSRRWPECLERSRLAG